MSAACIKEKCSPSLGLFILQDSLGLEMVFTQMRCGFVFVTLKYLKF